MMSKYYILQFTMIVNKNDVDMVENELIDQLRKEKAVHNVSVFKQTWE